MKKSLLILLFGMILLSVTAQDKKKLNVPADVVSSMAGLFPQIEQPGAYVKWEKDGIYYKLTTKGYKDAFNYAWADSTGKMIKFVERISLNVLPQKATDNLMSKYPGAEITEAYRIRQSIPQKSVTFQVKAIVKTEMNFDKEGNVTGEIK